MAEIKVADVIAKVLKEEGGWSGMPHDNVLPPQQASRLEYYKNFLFGVGI